MDALKLFRFNEYWPAGTHLFHKTRSRDQKILAFSAVGLKSLCFSVGTVTGDQAVVIVSGRERLAKKLQVVP
jgi:hypothetical protein